MALDRRGFLKFAAGGIAGSLFTPIPWKMIDDVSIWTQNWSWIPNNPEGKLSSKPSLVKLGSSEYGILIQTVNGQPITASGNPNHGLSLGGIDPLAASSVQLAYSPSRIKQPLQKDSSGKFNPISWNDATKLLQEKLEPVKGRQDSVSFISGDETSSANEIMAAFTYKMGSENYYFPPSDEQSQLTVWHSLMKGSGNIGYDLEDSDLVLAMGANILDSWGTVTRNQRLFGQDKYRLIYTGPTQTNTAVGANKFLPVQSEAQGHLALALAYYVMQSGITIQNIKRFREFYNFVTQNYDPRQSKQKTGLSEDTVYGLAKELLSAQNPLIIMGSLKGEGESGFPFYAALCLNLLLKFGNKGGIKNLPAPPQVLQDSPSLQELKKGNLYPYIQDVANENKNAPEILFIYEANPIYSLPNPALTRKFFDKIPLKVSFSPFMDETAAESDLILPTPYFLERYDDSFTPFGSGKTNYSAANPVQAPLTNSRNTPDFLLDLASKLRLDINIGSYKSLLQKKADLLNADWDSLIKGNMWTKDQFEDSGEIQFWNKNIEQMLVHANSPASNDNKLYLVPENKLKTGTDTTAFTPFLLKTFHDEEVEDNLIYARINGKTARKNNLRDKDRIHLVTPRGRCKARIILEEDVITDAIVVPTGFGHTSWDKFSRNVGDNVNKIMLVKKEKGSGLIHWNNTKVEIEKI